MKTLIKVLESASFLVLTDSGLQTMRPVILGEDVNVEVDGIFSDRTFGSAILPSVRYVDDV